MIVKDKNTLIDFFKQHGISLTKPRIDIGMLLLSMPRHISSSEIMDMVNKAFPYASRATIFNTINLFVEYNLIQKLDVPEGKSIFDTNTDTHHHIYNETTSEIVDFDISSELEQRLMDELLQNAPAEMSEQIKAGKMQITMHI